MQVLSLLCLFSSLKSSSDENSRVSLPAAYALFLLTQVLYALKNWGGGGNSNFKAIGKQKREVSSSPSVPQVPAANQTPFPHYGYSVITSWLPTKEITQGG